MVLYVPSLAVLIEKEKKRKERERKKNAKVGSPDGGTINANEVVRVDERW